MKWIVFCLALVGALPAFATCEGRDIRPDLSAADRAEIHARVAKLPFAQGNHWRATRGDQTVHLIGTIHVDDPRMADLTARLTGIVEAAELVLFETTPAQEAALAAAMSTQPDLVFMSDASLPDMMSEPDWQAVMSEMRQRSIPPMIASRFQPWYVSILLAIPPCMAETMGGGAGTEQNGLDHRLMRIAEDADVQIRALEPWDTLFSIFSDDPLDMQIDNLLIGLQTSSDGENMLATLRDAYFEQNHGEAWEVSRWKVMQTDVVPAAQVAALFNEMEEALLAERNRAWIPVILDALDGRRQITAAFGAGHLSGTEGILALLQAQGFELERLPF